MSPTAANLSDLTLAASAHVRAGRVATVADLVAGGVSDLVLANTATRTVERLREAHATLGTDRLAAVLGTLSQAALRAVLTRLDSHHTGVSRLPRADLAFLLQHIAEGGALVPADTDAEPITFARWSIAPVD